MLFKTRKTVPPKNGKTARNSKDRPQGFCSQKIPRAPYIYHLLYNLPEYNSCISSISIPFDPLHKKFTPEVPNYHLPTRTLGVSVGWWVYQLLWRSGNRGVIRSIRWIRGTCRCPCPFWPLWFASFGVAGRSLWLDDSLKHNVGTPLIER